MNHLTTIPLTIEPADYSRGRDLFGGDLDRVAQQVLRPPPRLRLSEWAARHGVLSPETSAMTGRFRAFGYQNGIMDAVTDPSIQEVVVMKSARVGYTKCLDHIVGYFIHHDPSPVLVVQPRVEDAEDYSRTEIAPMLRDTPVLHALVGDLKSRNPNQRIDKRLFPNGSSVAFVGANSPGGFRRITARVVLFDEVDGYPVQGAGLEGDQIQLGRKRTESYWNRKIVMGSTPTIKGVSRIEKAYKATDQRVYHVPCPQCGERQPITWASIKWDPGRPETAHMICVNGCVIDEAEKPWMIDNGAWVATAPFNGIAGFRIWAGYSLFPNASWANLAAEFLRVKEDPGQLKTFVNLVLGEPWEEDAEKVDPETLQGRAEDWPALPRPILLLTAGIDLQIDRAEVEVVGWGVGEESWSVEHRIIYGDPSGPELWKELTAYLESRFEVEGKGELAITAACIDSGYQTQAVYQWARDKFRRRFYPVKGIAGAGRPVWPKRASKNVKGGVNLFLVGVDAAKDMIYARLKLKAPGPGYCHFPKDRDAEYFRQLTAERVHTRHVKGFAVRVYEKDPSIRAEALDCRVYAYAALVSLNVNWGGLQKHFEPKPDPVATMPPPRLPDEPIPQPPPSAGVSRSGRRVIRSGFMSR